MGRLTIRVLDMVRGGPAVGLAVELYDSFGTRLAGAVTGPDGCPPEPLLRGEAVVAGYYEFRLQLGAYFAGGVAAPSPPFLDMVPVRVGLAEAAECCVSLLIAPYGYAVGSAG